MVIHLLPERIAGEDTDDLLAYTTPKVAVIRDRYVGCLYYIFILLALSWVLIGQVFWRNEHFMRKDVLGTTRMWITHPTLNQCDPNSADCQANFKSLVDLPYCSQAAGAATVPHPTECVFADKHTMFKDGTLGGQIFIPTSVNVMDEVRHCKPSKENRYSCDNEYLKTGEDDGYYLNETNLQYYANIEDFVIQFTSTYHREDIEGTSLDHQGYFQECFDEDPDKGKILTWEERLKKERHTCSDQRRVAIQCLQGVDCSKAGVSRGAMTVIEEKVNHDVKELQQKTAQEMGDASISFSAGRMRASRKKKVSRMLNAHEHGDKTERVTPDAYASIWGDSFKLGKLLELAGIDLDRHLNMDDLTSRMAGTIIEVDATYSNLRKFLSSFGFSEVQYTFRVNERKLPYVSKEIFDPGQPDDYPNRRRYLVQHGILLVFTVGGEFGFFNIVYLLIMLTTSMALLATAHKITDLISIYVHPRKENYFHMKYDVSGDFSEMWECPKCGYLNHTCAETCRGLAKWESAIDCKPCGEPRPPQSAPKTE